MFSRRQALIAGAASAALPVLATPSIAQFRLPARYEPQEVDVWAGLEPGQIYVIPSSFYLFWVEREGRAMRYGVGIGKAGLEMTGETVVARKAKWPFWRPTRDMIRREPEKYKKYAGGMKGGPNNPLGARALYLYRDGVDTLYRIHGTTQPDTIGQAKSNGCFRMVNDHVKDLYDRVPVGTRVTVIT